MSLYSEDEIKEIIESMPKFKKAIRKFNKTMEKVIVEFVHEELEKRGFLVHVRKNK